MWFHAPFNANQWMLYDMEVSGGRLSLIITRDVVPRAPFNANQWMLYAMDVHDGIWRYHKCIRRYQVDSL
jgi:acyl-CoA thioesterase